MTSYQRPPADPDVSPVFELKISTDDLPLTVDSDRLIAQDAPTALAALRRLDALDLADMLGVARGEVE